MRISHGLFFLPLEVVSNTNQCYRDVGLLVVLPYLLCVVGCKTEEVGLCVVHGAYFCDVITYARLLFCAEYAVACVAESG